MLLLFLIICLSTISLTNSFPIVNGRVVYHFNVTYAENSSSIILINNQIPGPLIEAELNDIIIVHVKNNLQSNEKLTIHFHGMLQQQTSQMDGVPFVTQIPIENQQTFSYVFHAYPAGTYFYHSHVGLQAITAFGGLIVHDRRRPWNIPEVPSGPLMFSDTWLSPDRLTQEHNLISPHFIWEGEPTYLLINGERDFVLTVDPNKQYLLRLIGATTLSTVVFGIDEHPMTVVEVDGTLIKPKQNVQSIEIASGQRYGVIIQTKKKASRIYLMQLVIRWREISNGSSCTGVLRYSTTSRVPTNLSSYPVPSLPSEADLRAFTYSQPYQTLLDIDQMPKRSADKEIILNSAEYATGTPGNFSLRWRINNASLDETRLANLTRPLLFDVYNGIDKTLPTDVVYSIRQNQIIDIVLQNTVATPGICETHPFHLHGHKFWVHSQGTGLYNASANKILNSNNPVFRDTVILYPTSQIYTDPHTQLQNYQKPCGWTKIRFIADNPGLWLLHCHIGAHAFIGMTVLFNEDPEHLVMNYMSQN